MAGICSIKCLCIQMAYDFRLAYFYTDLFSILYWVLLVCISLDLMLEMLEIKRSAGSYL